jgi:hypothetical protein
MSACVSCSTELDPLWKFCVTCGTPAVSPHSAQLLPSNPIPGDLRPRQRRETRRPPTIPRAAILVIALAIIGIVASFFAAAAALR